MPTEQSGYLSPKLFACADLPLRGRGVFTRDAVARGEVLAIWGGEAITWEQLLAMEPGDRRLAVQVDENHYLVSVREGSADWVNHSCAPNAGLSGQVVLVAMRDIGVGEEILYDYAMTDGSDYDVFECSCGARDCRKQITGCDWQRPELWDRYNGYFSPYLARRIAMFRAQQPRRAWMATQ